MRVLVIGDTHCAWMTAAWLATRGPKHDVTLYGGSDSLEQLSESEPGLKETLPEFRVVVRGLSDRGPFDLAWVAQDTPLDESGAPDCEVLRPLLDLAADMSEIVILSSQVPLGYCAWARDRIGTRRKPQLFYVPENMRRGRGLDTFLVDRLVVGVERTMRPEETLLPPELALLVELFGMSRLYGVSRVKLIGVQYAAAEMIKHATNAFLATSVSLANELAAIGEPYGVDFAAVTQALRADRRIGPGAYLEAGRPFTGGTLKRDLRALQQAARGPDGPHPLPIWTPLIDAVLDVNQRAGG